MDDKEIKPLSKTFSAHWQHMMLLATSALFFLLRIPALFQPYHQDEYKWAMAVGFEQFWSPSIPHPPLARFLYLVVSKAFGNDSLRLMPLIIGFATMLLLYFVVKRYYGAVAAFFAAILFAVIPYSVIGSLQIDIDGAVLPFASLITIYGYLRFREPNSKKNLWAAVFAIGVVGGFLSKLSFVIVLGSIAVHFIFEKYYDGLSLEQKRIAVRKATYVFFGMLVLFPIFFWVGDHVFIFRYIKNFTHISGRNYFELFFLTAKAAIYLSPILVVGLFLNIKSWQRLSLWYIFSIFSMLFYAVVFDFTHRTLDRYWMVLTIPLIVITSVYLSEVIKGLKRRDGAIAFLTLVVVASGGYFIFSMPHEVLPLNPKPAFIHALLSLHWNILIPLSGGSGPVGLYVSLLGVLFSFFTIIILGCISIFWVKSRKKIIAIALISITLVYSALINSEYLTGRFYGSAPKVLALMLSEIRTRDDITEVITYNDSGAYDLIQMKKYYKRFYADPAYVEGNKEKFNLFNGFFMVLDFPSIDKNSFYWKYFENCKLDSVYTDKQIKGYIFDCRISDNRTSLLNHQ